jgi:para-aminobenzoate synthetase component 1
MRKIIYIDIKNKKNFDEKLLEILKDEEYIAHYNTNKEKINIDTKFLYSDYETITAYGKISDSYGEILNPENLKKYINSQNDWFFGFFSYDYKNHLENLTSNNFDGINVPDYFFFQPEIVFIEKNKILEIHYFENITSTEKIKFLKEKILKLEENKIQPKKNNVELKQRIDKNSYLKKASELKNHIKIGNIYEINLCMEFYSENTEIEETEIFNKLNSLSPTPFAAFFKLKDKILISASPERYLKKSGMKIISQPIKGTAARNENLEIDNENKIRLENDEKERSENIMIVDLVRNDLSRTAKKGSVKVEELCGIYPFSSVFQMISTISSELKSEELYIDVINTSFPPGSMTGAPKIRAMELIEEFEETKRGLYSGSVGYFSPEKDFDFNVVIRSIIYNKTAKYLSYSVGSAITDKSVPEKEYEECLLKAETMKSVLLIC